MRITQLALFDLEGMMGKQTVSVEAFFSEFQSLSRHQRNYAGYGGDVRAERSVRELTQQGEISYKQWKGMEITDEVCKDALYEFIVRLWCVLINGKVSRDIYQNPNPAKVYKPVFDDNFISRIPPEVMNLIPTERVLLVCYEENMSIEQRGYLVTYYLEDSRRWYSVFRSFDNRKGKWLDSNTMNNYGKQMRADKEHQWWTQKGFDKAKADDKLDPQIAGVWTNFVRFYGRDEALCRLGLPPVSTGYDERDYKECEQYGWYSAERKNDQFVQSRRSNSRRSSI